MRYTTILLATLLTIGCSMQAAQTPRAEPQSTNIRLERLLASGAEGTLRITLSEGVVVDREYRATRRYPEFTFDLNRGLFIYGGVEYPLSQRALQELSWAVTAIKDWAVVGHLEMLEHTRTPVIEIRQADR